MEDFEEQSLNGRNARAGRIRWSEQMNSHLLECKREAPLLAKSENPPVQDNGRRKGYMELMKELWDQMGHEDMGFTKQNLRDQAARLEKSLGSLISTITNGIKAKRGGDNAEGALNNGRQIAKNADQEEPNLHTTLIKNQQRDKNQQLNNSDQERCSFLEPANRIMETISTHPGDYSQRDIDTRTRETPLTQDLEEINQTIKLLMEHDKVTPTQNPFGFLWLANCVLHLVVCAFLLMKGWKKQGQIKADKPQDRKKKLKNLRPGGGEDQKTTVNPVSGNRKVERKKEGK